MARGELHERGSGSAFLPKTDRCRHYERRQCVVCNGEQKWGTEERDGSGCSNDRQRVDERGWSGQWTRHTQHEHQREAFESSTACAVSHVALSALYPVDPLSYASTLLTWSALPLSTQAHTERTLYLLHHHSLRSEKPQLVPVDGMHYQPASWTPALPARPNARVTDKLLLAPLHRS